MDAPAKETLIFFVRLHSTTHSQRTHIHTYECTEVKSHTNIILPLSLNKSTSEVDINHF